MRCEGILLDRLAVVVIHLELLLLVDLRLRRPCSADDHAFVEHHLAQRLADVGVLADHFGDDVARAFERLLDRGDALLRIDKRGREFAQRSVRGS